MAISIPFKQMINWKTGNLAPTLIAVTYLALPWLFGKALSQTTIMFGMLFLCISIIKAKASPTVLGSLFTALLGLTYFFAVFTSLSDATLWTVAIALFAVAFVFEIGLFKFGPANKKAEALTVVPLTLLGFSLVLGLAGVNPLIKFNWSFWTVALSYFAVMMYCWLYVLDVGGYRPLGAKTNVYMNLMALAAFAMGVLGAMQGSGIIAW